MSKARIATAWLDGCSGCHMSVLDLDEVILAVLDRADIVYGPLVDTQTFPENVDVTLVEGAVSNQDDLHLIQRIRQRTRILVALGDCAVTGNVPSMRNNIPVKRLLERGYLENATETQQVPVNGVPPLLKSAVPIRHYVTVDVHVPGCPPKPAAIARAVMDLLDGKAPAIAGAVQFG